MSKQYELSLDLIEPNPKQSRTYFDSDSQKELESSIASLDVLQPILVQPFNGRFRIVAGERRFRACKTLGFKTIPAVVLNEKLRKKLEKGEISEEELQWTENEQRKGLTALEEAKTFEILMKRHNLTQRALARRLGKSEAYISERKNLLRLPKSTKEQVRDGSLDFSLARLLAKAPADKIEELSKEVVEKKTTAREFKKTIDETRKDSSTRKKRGTDPKKTVAKIKTNIENAVNTLSKVSGDNVDLGEAAELLKHVNIKLSNFLKEEENE